MAEPGPVGVGGAIPSVGAVRKPAETGGVAFRARI